ncbi:MAG: TolC family protein [Pseudomonadota bacterium]|nr:TolC family protein [Pseudomonadota bacterium]
MSRRVLIAMMVSALAGPAGAAPLSEELRGLLSSHPDLHSAEQRLEQARSAVVEAWSGFLPRLRFTGEYGYENVDSPVRRAAGGDAVSQGREAGNVTVTQKLFDGFRTDGVYQAAIAREFKAGYSMERTEQQLLLRGTVAYLAVLKQTELVDIALETEATVRRQLALEDERVRRGSGLSVDVLQSKSRLQGAKETRVTLEGQLREAIAEYIAVFETAPEFGQMEPPRTPEAFLPPELHLAIDRALTENPLMRQSEETIGEARQERKVAMSGFLPQIDVVAEGAMDNDAEGIPGNRKELFVGLRADWTLFDGFATVAATRRTGNRIAETMSNHMSLGRDIARRVEVAWQQLVTLRERQALAENAASIAAELFTARSKLRTAGRDSVVNLLDAERQLNDARSRAAAARYDALVQAYRLLFEMGVLNLEAYEG